MDERRSHQTWSEYRGEESRSWILPLWFVEWCMEWIAFQLNRLAIVDIATTIGALSILVPAWTYVMESDDREEIARRTQVFQAWQVINTAAGKGGSGGVLDAMHDLRELGVAMNGINLNRAMLGGVDLSGWDLRGAQLDDAVLIGARLNEAKLSQGSMRGAQLMRADLRGAVLFGTDLRHADLRDAKLEGAILINADLSGADLDLIDFRGVNLKGANLSGTNLELATIPAEGLASAFFCKGNPPIIGDDRVVAPSVRQADDDACKKD